MTAHVSTSKGEKKFSFIVFDRRSTRFADWEYFVSIVKINRRK